MDSGVRLTWSHAALPQEAVQIILEYGLRFLEES